MIYDFRATSILDLSDTQVFITLENKSSFQHLSKGLQTKWYKRKYIIFWHSFSLPFVWRDPMRCELNNLKNLKIKTNTSDWL